MSRVVEDRVEAPPSADANAYSAEAERAFSGQTPSQSLEPLGQIFLAEFAKAELDRRETEDRWLKDLRQYRGRYDPDEEAAIGPTRSKSFVRKTRVKVKTVDSRVADLLFPAGNDKNWDISPTPVPTISAEERAKLVGQLRQAAEQTWLQQQQAAQQAQQAPPADPSGAQGDPANPAGQPGPTVAPQPQATPQKPPSFEPPKDVVDAVIMEQVTKAAKEMTKAIDDQLTECRYKQQALLVLHSGHLYGTGILKGPLVERKVRMRFKKVGKDWKPVSESYLVPFVDSVPVWRFYPDMNATTLDQCQFVYERHTFTHAKLFDLTKNNSFDKEKIVSHLTANPDGMAKIRTFDSDLKQIGDRASKNGDILGQYEVLERWGYIDGLKLKSAGVSIPVEREQESFFANVWMLPNGTIIKAVLQPLNGITWPYHMYYFDKDETSIFGEGLSSIMRDDQKMLNAAVRMMLDNGAITSGPMVEIIQGLLSSSDDASALAPWKVYLRNGQSPGTPAVRAIELPNNIEFLKMMAEMFDNNADETTAIPRYMNGENASSGAAGTSSGLSMLMGAVNIVIKDLITGYDEGVTVSFLKGLYHWNMQFNKNDAVKGDFDVNARGTASLVAKEVRARQLNEFATLVADPLDAPFVKRHELNQQRAEALELSNIIKTKEEVEADQEGPEAQRAQKLQQQMQDAQLAEQQAKVGRLTAQTALDQSKVKELLKRLEVMAQEMLESQAKVELTLAETVSKKVEAVFAALQAGGVATSRPTIAPAGDEILKSSGWVDATPDPSIADLDTMPVQADQGTNALLNRGQTFAAEPRGDGSEAAPEQGAGAQAEEANGQPVAAGGADAGDNRPDVANATAAMKPEVATPEPATGMVGRRHGIETDRIEQ